MIEDQLARVGENGALAVNSIRTRFQTVALKLLTAIVDFYDSALEYFSHGIVRKSSIYQVIISRPSSLQHFARHRDIRYREEGFK